MAMLAAAIVVASLMGSMHCVGMCGPLAIWASGVAASESRGRVFVQSSLYHIGRLTTYVIAGLVAGAIGSVVDSGGQALGIQLAAARIVGALMVGVGVYKLAEFLGWWKWKTSTSLSQIGGLLVRLRPYVTQLPGGARALVTGLLTTLLPCGWLYVFAMVAAGTGSAVGGAVVMAAFWLGTVPALISLVVGVRSLSKKFDYAIPILAACLLILTGCYTASGRGFADLESLASLEASVAESDIEELHQAPLPCCQNHGKR